MTLLATTGLVRAFSERVSGSDRVDVAVAWLGPSRAFDIFIQRIKCGQLRARVAVGLSGNATSPIALRSLQDAGAQIKIGRSATGIFHPKFYLFRATNQNVCWIGSSNFTLQGFTQNSELINEFTDDGSALLWFEDLWTHLPVDSSGAIDHYAQNWKRPSPIPRSASEPKNVLAGTLPELLSEVMSWREYVAALHTCDEYWQHQSAENFSTRFSVLGDE